MQRKHLLFAPLPASWIAFYFNNLYTSSAAGRGHAPHLDPPRRWSCWLLALTTASLALCPAPARGHLHADGTRILDGNNQPLILRGVNLGTWLYVEPAMMGNPDWSAFPGVDDFEKLNAIVQDLMEGDTNLTAQVLDALRSNFVRPEDIVFLHGLGFNCVRVPFHYRLFYDPGTGQDLNTGFVYLDSLVAWCSTNGIYVIPDMHGVPGGKDYGVAGNVFTDGARRAQRLSRSTTS